MVEGRQLGDDSGGGGPQSQQLDSGDTEADKKMIRSRAEAKDINVDRIEVVDNDDARVFRIYETYAENNEDVVAIQVTKPKADDMQLEMSFEQSLSRKLDRLYEYLQTGEIDDPNESVDDSRESVESETQPVTETEVSETVKHDGETYTATSRQLDDGETVGKRIDSSLAEYDGRIKELEDRVEEIEERLDEYDETIKAMQKLTGSDDA